MSPDAGVLPVEPDWGERHSIFVLPMILGGVTVRCRTHEWSGTGDAESIARALALHLGLES